MIVYPKAKVNIGLRVTEKRPDGFHNLESLLVSIPNHTDILEIVEAPHFSFHQYGIELKCAEGENLCERAFRLLQREYKIPNVEIHLVKKIAFGAGLGGGSSNAASTLTLLNALFQLNIDLETLLHYAAELGSDVPFFILENLYSEGGQFYTALIKDRGEKPTPLKIEQLQNYRIELYPHSTAVSTAEAFSWVEPNAPQTPLEKLLLEPIEKWPDRVVNDFEKPLFKRYPELKLLKEELYQQGAHFVAMSGSGATLFALFPS